MTGNELLEWFRQWAESTAQMEGVTVKESDALRFIAVPALEDALAGRYEVAA